MPKVTELNSGIPSKNDVMIFDGTNGTKKFPFSDLALTMLKTANHSSAGFHNSIYRGVNLKTHWGLSTDSEVVNKVTTNIYNGSFEDLFIGDYFNVTIDTSLGGTETVTCVIAGFDIYMNCGDTALTRHHAVIVPKDCFKTTSQMNSSHTTNNAYKGSAMYQNILPIYASALQTALNNKIINHRELLSKSMNANTPSGAYSAWNGASSDWEWTDSLIELMSEPEVYGCRVLSSSFYDIGIAKSQLPLFRLNPGMIQANRTGAGRQWYWLKAVAGSTAFCDVNYDGHADCDGAGYSYGVRPRFLIG